MFNRSNFFIIWSITCGFCAFLERSFLCSILHLWSHISNPTIQRFFNNRAVHRRGLCFEVRNVEVYYIHSRVRNPSKSSCHPIIFWDNIAADNTREVHACTLCESPRHLYSWINIICTVSAGVSLSNSLFSSYSIDVSHLELASLLVISWFGSYLPPHCTMGIRHYP